jgi:hypothetical protein
MVDIFEQATKVKLRFSSAKGQLTTEDLWDLPLTKGQVNLDNIAIALDKKIKETSATSFVTKNPKVNLLDTLALNVLKRIIEVKLTEQEAADKAAATKEMKQKILGYIAEKQDDTIRAKSLEELQALLQTLG